MRLRTALVLLTAPLLGAAAGRAVSAVVVGGWSDPAPRTERFHDVSIPHGLSARHRAVSPCGYNAAAVAWGDVDGDDDLDVFLPRQVGRSQLWQQGADGRFRERGRSSGLADAGTATAAAFADYDDDGDQDLYVGAAGPDRLYENEGRGSFREAEGLLAPAPRLRVRGRRGPGLSAFLVDGLGASELAPAMDVSWIDFDRDARLDVHVANGNSCFDDPAPAPDTLYRNLGHGRFRDVSHLLPAEASSGVTLAAAWLDGDGDGDHDLYLGNDDLDGRANALLDNVGGRFVDISTASGAGLSRSTMGLAVGDVDGDARPDLAVTDIGREALLVQDAPGHFTEEAESRGFGRERVAPDRESVTWGITLADFDNDSDLDAYAAAGALGLDRQRQNDVLYENDGAGHFRRFEVRAPGSGRTVAPANWDRDGDVDLLVAQIDSRPLLLENRGPPDGHWLELELTGRRSTRQACGALLTLRAAGAKQWRQVECQSGDRLVHFGLGAARRAERLVIRWPSGVVQRRFGLASDRRLVVVEPPA